MSLEASSRWLGEAGVSLRPWSGSSPVSLIARGALQVAVSGFLLVVLVRISRGDGMSALPGELDALRRLTVPLAVIVGVLALVAVARICVGVLDLLVRRRVRGTVLSLKERRVGDRLPTFVQEMIFERNPQHIDRRRWRTEVVLRTDGGERRWTVRRSSVARALEVGAQVELTVTAIAGHVARAETLTRRS